MSNAKYFGAAVLGIVAIVAIGALAVVGSTVMSISSVATAPQRVITRTLDTTNIISSYERFRDLNSAFNSRLAQVKQYKELLKNETDQSEKRRLRIEFSAIQQTCRDDANKYNADSSKMNKAIFRHDAPVTLDADLCE